MQTLTHTHTHTNTRTHMHKVCLKLSNYQQPSKRALPELKAGEKMQIKREDEIKLSESFVWAQTCQRGTSVTVAEALTGLSSAAFDFFCVRS